MVQLSRRTLLKGLVLTAGGLVVPNEVLLPAGRRFWALNATHLGGRGARANALLFDEPSFIPIPMEEWARVLKPVEPPSAPLLRGDLEFNQPQRFNVRICPDRSRLWVTDIAPDGRLTVTLWGADDVPTTAPIAPGDAHRVGDQVATAQTAADRLDACSRQRQLG